MRNWKWLVTAALPLLWMLPAAGVPVWSGAAEEPVPPPKAAPGKPGNGAGGFYGVEVRAEKRVVFLVDVSGSMGAVTPEGGSRLDVMKRELRRAVGSAERGREFPGLGVLVGLAAVSRPGAVRFPGPLCR